MTTIIVCGGRSYGRVPDNVPGHLYEQYAAAAENERARLDAILHAAVERLGMRDLSCGDATGADALAAAWAERVHIPFRIFVAEWHEHGSNAGPIRNRVMLEQSQPSAVIAFPGSKGTRNMCSLAEKAGVRVIKVDW